MQVDRRVRTRRLSAAELAALRAEGELPPLKWGGTMTPEEVERLEARARGDAQREAARLARKAAAKRAALAREAAG